MLFNEGYLLKSQKSTYKAVENICKAVKVKYTVASILTKYLIPHVKISIKWWENFVLIFWSDEYEFNIKSTTKFG